MREGRGLVAGLLAAIGIAAVVVIALEAPRYLEMVRLGEEVRSLELRLSLERDLPDRVDSFKRKQAEVERQATIIRHLQEGGGVVEAATALEQRLIREGGWPITWLYTRDRGIEFALETEDAQPVVRIAETLVEEGLLSWADLNWLDGSVGVPDGESGLLLRGEAALPEEDAEVE